MSGLVTHGVPLVCACDTCGRQDTAVLVGLKRFLFCQWCGSVERIFPTDQVLATLPVIDIPVPCNRCDTPMTHTPVTKTAQLWNCSNCGDSFYFDEKYDETLSELPK